MKLAVEIEDIDSWPRDFREEALNNKALLISYHQEYRRISRLGEKDIKARVNPPNNKYKDEYIALVDNLEQILFKHNIVGYHCTRLTPREQTAIKENSLKMLTKNLIQQRLNNALKDKLITKWEYQYLLNSKHLQKTLDKKEYRTGMIWFCPNLSTFKEYDGVYRLFRYWGGEALYWGHENDENISNSIKQLGTPCIVKCALPFHDVDFYHNYTARFLSYVVSDIIKYPEPSVDFDMYIKRDLCPEEVLEIIDISNPRFVQMIDYDKWKNDFPLV